MNERSKDDYKNYYELGEIIYKGEHSTIYKGKEKKSNEFRAIKIIDLSIIKDKILQKYKSSEINKELKAYIDIRIYEFQNMKECSLKNNNSLEYYEYFINDNEFIIIMELCDNNILNILQEIKKGFIPNEIYKIMKQLNLTFKLISKKNIILKSLKIEDILIKYTYNNDFIVKLSNYGTPSIKCKEYAEILSHIFPKKFEEQKNFEDNMYDLWNIGIIIYRLFFIESPYKDNNEYQIEKIKHTRDKYLDNLINILLITKERKSLNWEKYFLHPFFIKDYIIITYKIKKDEDKIKLFGDQFFINNKNLKNKIDIIFENKLYEFEQYFIIKNIAVKNTLTIKLAGINEFTDVSHMFNECQLLLSVSQISNWDSSHITTMKCMFNRCKNLISLPDISYLNTSLVKNMSFLFSRCKSLVSLPDIFRWDTSNVKDMSYMFHKCKSLKSISDLSKWNTTNVTKISNIFFKCDSLSSKPQIYTKKKENSFLLDYKIIIIGNSDTNKTAFVNKYTKNNFNDAYKATIVSEFGFKIFEYGDNLYRVQLWDLAGQDKNSMVTKLFAKDAHGVVVMSNACNIQSREDSIKWKKSIEELKFFDGKELPCILVENNIELLPDDEHNDSSFEEFWKNNGFMKGFRVSSKTGENINESMEFLIKKIIKRMEIITENKIEEEEDENKNYNGRNNISLGNEKDNKDKKRKKENKNCILF